MEAVDGLAREMQVKSENDSEASTFSRHRLTVMNTVYPVEYLHKSVNPAHWLFTLADVLIRQRRTTFHSQKGEFVLGIRIAT